MICGFTSYSLLLFNLLIPRVVYAGCLIRMLLLRDLYGNDKEYKEIQNFFLENSKDQY
jgi:hypothetical protein